MNKDQIMQAFDKAAAKYDSHADFQKKVAERLADELSSLPSPTSICEIGCGTGFLTQRLRELHPSAKYLAIDLSPKMIEMCRAKTGNSPMINYQAADAENFEFNRDFDWVVSNLAMQWLENFEAAIQKYWKKTQMLAFSTLIDGTFQEWHIALEKIGVKQKAFEFPSVEKISQACATLKPAKMRVFTEEHRQFFTDPLNFARQLKNTGAAKAKENYQPANLWKLSKMLPNGIEISYRVAYCILQR